MGSREPDEDRAEEIGVETEARAAQWADADQTSADRDQMAADGDQTAADSDQAAADSDQAAADSDQAASDREFDLVEGGDATVFDESRQSPDRTTGRREHSTGRRFTSAAARDASARDRTVSAAARDATALERDLTAVARDATARARDLSATARDEAAEQRDRDQAARDAAWEREDRSGSTAEVRRRAAQSRERAAVNRAEAAEHRLRAAADRELAARDREQAARELQRANDYQTALLRQLAVAETDALTGARARGPGLRDLGLEIVRSRRTTGRLAAAYVDVVGLKAVNDRQGHTAGDAMLQRVVREIRAVLRPYDLVIRLGGDEFLCAMSGASSHEAEERFATVRAALAQGPGPCDIKVGFAVLQAGDTAEALIGRADSDLPTTSTRS